MSTTHAGRENPTDATELPANWAETQTTVIARFERDDGAVVRVRTDFAVRSAAECNNATHTDATGTVEVVFNAEPLPSDAETIYEGGTEADARKAALAFMREDYCPQHNRPLITDAAGCLHCPACTGADR